MSYIQYNPNPQRKHIEDCTVRAICKVTGQSWEDAYLALMVQGFLMYDMPNSIPVFNAYLKKIGWRKGIIPNTCPDCYTVEDFANEHKDGKYIVATNSHVIAIEDGCVFDTWDSTMELCVFYWRKEVKENGNI